MPTGVCVRVRVRVRVRVCVCEISHYKPFENPPFPVFQEITGGPVRLSRSMTDTSATFADVHSHLVA